MSETAEGTTFGIAQLDNMAIGTMGRGSLALLYGPSGTGKSSVAAHFSFKGAEAGESVLLITDDPVEKRIEDMSRFRKWNPSWIDDGYLTLFRFKDILDLVGLSIDEMKASDVNIVLDLLIASMDKMETKRLVIDPVNPLAFLLEKWPSCFFLSDLKQEMYRRSGVAVMVYDSQGKELSNLPGAISQHNFEVLIEFDKAPGGSSTFNTLKIQRWKSSPHSKSTYVVDVSEEGVIMVPRILGSGVCR